MTYLIPNWITSESWQAFEESRKRIKAPLTQYAGKLILVELCKLKSSGENPQDCLDQSIRNGWRDVFPVKDKGLRSVSAGVSATQELLREQAEHAKMATKPPAKLLAMVGKGSA